MCDDHNRFSVILIPRNLKLYTCCNSAPLTQLCVVALIFTCNQLFGFANIEQQTFLCASFCKTVYFPLYELSCGVVRKLNNRVLSTSRSAVIGAKVDQEGSEHITPGFSPDGATTALRCYTASSVPLIASVLHCSSAHGVFCLPTQRERHYLSSPDTL